MPMSTCSTLICKMKMLRKIIIKLSILWCWWQISGDQVTGMFCNRMLLFIKHIKRHKSKIGRVKQKCASKHAQYAKRSNHPAHVPSIIWTFAPHSYILQYPMILLAAKCRPWSDCTDAQVIFAFAVRICPKARFRGQILSRKTFTNITL